MEYESILIEPVLSEKSNIMRESGQYVFKVDRRADKIMVMEAVRRIFKVNPISCNIINVASKPKRLRGRPGYTAEWKKAIVRLPKGETIRVFEGA
jgi:large subunit ribosomal protein L23